MTIRNCLENIFTTIGIATVIILCIILSSYSHPCDVPWTFMTHHPCNPNTIGVALACKDKSWIIFHLETKRRMFGLYISSSDVLAILNSKLSIDDKSHIIAEGIGHGACLEARAIHLLRKELPGLCRTYAGAWVFADEECSGIAEQICGK